MSTFGSIPSNCFPYTRLYSPSKPLPIVSAQNADTTKVRLSNPVVIGFRILHGRGNPAFQCHTGKYQQYSQT